MVKHKRILVLGTSIGAGDLPPLIAVAVGLAGNGHDVLFIGDEPLADLTRGTILGIESVPKGLEQTEYRARRLRLIAESPDSPAPRWWFSEWAADVFPTIRERIDDYRPEVAICSGFALPLGTMISKEFAIPLCLINSTFYFGPGSRRTVEEDFALKDPAIVAAAVPFLDQIDLALHGTDSEFDPPPATAPSHHHWVGPLLWEPIVSQPSYLEEPGNPWALVTLSMLRQAGEATLARTTLNALEGLPVRVLLTLGDPSARDELGRVPDKVRIESFVPHSEVLGRAALSVSHAGHGIVSKSMFYGVPMVLVPWDRDQPGVAARARRLGVAAVIPRDELSEERLREAIREVLTDPRYLVQARSTAERLQAQDSVAVACAHIEQL